jgi:hypothetical protein
MAAPRIYSGAQSPNPSSCRKHTLIINCKFVCPTNVRTPDRHHVE